MKVEEIDWKGISPAAADVLLRDIASARAEIEQLPEVPEVSEYFTRLEDRAFSIFMSRIYDRQLSDRDAREAAQDSFRLARVFGEVQTEQERHS